MAQMDVWKRMFLFKVVYFQVPRFHVSVRGSIFVLKYPMFKRFGGLEKDIIKETNS